MSGPRSSVQELLFGLRIAVTTIAAAVVATASLPRKIDLHDPVAPQVVAYSTLVVLLGVEIALLVGRREWGWLRLPALGLCLGASVLATAKLRPEFLTTSSDWSFGTTGWLAVVLLFNRPLWELAVFLAAHELVTIVRALLLPHLSEDFVLNLIAGSVGTIGFPLACGIASTALRGIAVRAERAAAQAAGIRTAEEVAVRRHEARNARLRQLDATTEPLLQGLAQGALSPEDAAVQRTCRIEASRIRRMLAETDLADDPLIHELDAGADVAERRLVLIERTTAGSWLVPDLAVRRALLEGPLAVLSTARTWARVTVIGATDTVSINVVADTDMADRQDWTVPQPTHNEVEYRVITDDQGIWIEAQWTGPHRSLPQSEAPAG